MKYVVFKLVLLVCILQVASCASPLPQQNRVAQPLDLRLSDTIQPATAMDLDDSRGYRYRLSVGDQLEIKFFRRQEYNTQVIVAPDGTITLPFLYVIRAEGKTVEELIAELETRYRQLSNNSPKPINKKYLISVGDVLEIKFPFVDKYSATVKVRPDGRISLPLIGSVIAEGKDPEELQAELQKFYQKSLKNSALVVSVVEAVSNFVMSNGKIERVALPEMNNLYVSLRSSIELKVYVGGEVKNPRAIRYNPMLSSLQAILEAGGVTSKSELESVIILRKGFDGEPRYIVRNLAADIYGKESSQDSDVVVTNDIALRPFDIVIVPKTGIATVSDGLNAYLFDLLPMLRNSSIGFNYQIGTMKVDQNTNIVTP